MLRSSATAARLGAAGGHCRQSRRITEAGGIPELTCSADSCYGHYLFSRAACDVCKTADWAFGSPQSHALSFYHSLLNRATLFLQRLMLNQALDDVCSSPAAFISALAEPDLSEGPGSPNSSSPMRSHGFDIEHVNQIYRAILQVCGSQPCQ